MRTRSQMPTLCGRARALLILLQYYCYYAPVAAMGASYAPLPFAIEIIAERFCVMA